MARMTDNEFNQKMDRLLLNVPESIAKFVRSTAYDRGHSAGYEEVLSIAESLVSELDEVITELRMYQAEDYNRQQAY